MGGAKAGNPRLRQDCKARARLYIAQVARLWVIVAQDLRKPCLIFRQIAPPSALRAATSPFVLRKNGEDLKCLFIGPPHFHEVQMGRWPAAGWSEGFFYPA